jgi:hypothetical protein
MAELKSYLINVPQENKRTAAHFEEVFIQLHETLRKEVVSFEIVATGQNIAFCLTAIPSVAAVVIGQIYASAPDAIIEEISDPTIVKDKNTKAAAAEVTLKRSDLFPLRDFRQFEGDSLSGILSVLSTCVPGEVVIIQLTVKPAVDSWLHHLRQNWRRKATRASVPFMVKYWFKKNTSNTFAQKFQEKLSGRLFRTNIRVLTLSSSPQADPSVRLTSVIGALSNFNDLDLNQLAFQTKRIPIIIRAIQQRYLSGGYLLATKELATFFHLPAETEVPNILHVLSKKEAPPKNLPTQKEDKEIAFFGATNFRGQSTPFGIKYADRRRHLYVVGKSGSGKSKLLELLIANDINSGRGVGVLDPHGDLVDNVLKIIPKHRLKDVVIFDPSDLNFPASFNPLEQVPEALKMRVTIGFIEIFKKLFGTNWSPRLEHVLRYTTLALLDSPGTTVLSILKMLSNKNYRQMIVRNIKDNVVKNFWVNEFAGWSERFDSEAITPLLNKVGQFVATNMIRNIVGQPTNRFDFRKMMDEKKIILMKVSKGILGEENASLLGAIAVTKIYQAAMSRADTPEEQRTDFYFYVDEFQNFATDTFGEILSEARKYRLNLTIANQFLGQLDVPIRKTVFGNVGSMISFRLGAEDASIMATEFNPRFTARDIINLGVRDFCLKMTIDGEIREAFSGKTLPMVFPEKDYVKECVDFSRATYARPLSEVTEILQQWEEGATAAPVKPGVTAPVASISSSLDEQADFEEPLI